MQAAHEKPTAQSTRALRACIKKDAYMKPNETTNILTNLLSFPRIPPLVLVNELLERGA